MKKITIFPLREPLEDANDKLNILLCSMQTQGKEILSIHTLGDAALVILYDEDIRPVH